MDEVQRTPIQKVSLYFEIYWKTVIITSVPIILLPLMALNDWMLPFRCMYVICIMTIYWITEAMPLPVTSMIPIVVFPLLGILDENKTCGMYMKDTIIMFLSGLIIANAIEFCNLHKRIALRIIKVVGCSTRRLSFGLTFTTMFISFWISNTATTAMMSPVAEAVLLELERNGSLQVYSITETADGIEIKRPTKLTVGFFLGIAYGATIGGSGTIIGSGANLAFKSVFTTRFPDARAITFTNWFLFCSPLAILSTFLTWIWLQLVYMGLWRPNSTDAKVATMIPEVEEVTRNIIIKRYDELGPMTTHEKSTLILFLIAISLLLSQDPGFIKGWSSHFAMDIPESVPALGIVIMFFILPMDYKFLKFFYTNNDESLPQTNSQSLLTWEYIQDRIPWGLMLLLGSGYAIAAGGKHSGMSKFLGYALRGIESLPNPVILLLVCLTSSVLTEITANSPITNILLPIYAELAIAIKMNPVYLMVPGAVCCCWSFHTIVGTPPNAIISAYAHIRSKDLAFGGIGPSIITLLAIWLGFQTWGQIIYPASSTFPEWAEE